MAMLGTCLPAWYPSARQPLLDTDGYWASRDHSAVNLTGWERRLSITAYILDYLTIILTSQEMTSSIAQVFQRLDNSRGVSDANDSHETHNANDLSATTSQLVGLS
uniref:Uncharacterized protein n=1 Tax=Branchiostoma floridae TaxID=7739 RepID=C3ZA43_BRAFL|eukprot:XP_002594620.1 hypothetical protein BRAFLDRAFT_77594 [Branchiostoma floridae]